MPSLLEVQCEMRAALLGGDAEALAALVEPDDLEGVAVHINNVGASLTSVLADAFPAVQRLVDARFFAYAAHVFITQHPPRRPRLAEYGDAFPDFLAAFPPCRELTYLPDVARLEWALHRAANEAAQGPIYVSSPFPVDAIWRANRADGEPQEIDLNAGPVHLEIMRRDGDVVMRALPPEGDYP